MNFPRPVLDGICRCEHFRYQHDPRGVDSRCYAMEDECCDRTEYRELPKECA